MKYLLLILFFSCGTLEECIVINKKIKPGYIINEKRQDIATKQYYEYNIILPERYYLIIEGKKNGKTKKREVQVCKETFNKTKYLSHYE